MPLDMPESVLFGFKDKLQPGTTLRDLVNAIPLYAIKAVCSLLSHAVPPAPSFRHCYP